MAENKLPPLPDPLEEEHAALPSAQLEETFKEKAQVDYTKHLATKIRENYPDIGDASDEEAFQTFHKLELADSTPEELWQVLGKLYGGSFKPAQPPLISVTEPSTIGAMAADIPVALWQDITAIPKGFAEMVPGMIKYSQPNLQDQKEGEELLKRAEAHLIRGGAFGAATALTGGVASLLGKVPFLSGAKSFIPRALQNTAKGAADVGTFMGSYSAIREAGKEGVTPAHVWDAFQEGTVTGAKFGAALGAGTTIGGSLIAAARNAGELTRNAKTVTEAKNAAAHFSTVFQPEWAPDGVMPKEAAVQVITELYGPDVAASSTGQQAIKIIEKKIKNYQDNLVKNAFKEEPTAPAVEAPKTERRVGDRRTTEVPPEVERRQAVDRRQDIRQMEQTRKVAEDDLTKLETMTREELEAFYNGRYPGLGPFSNKAKQPVDELRAWLQRELQAQVKGSQQAYKSLLENQYKDMTLEQLVEKIKTATDDERPVLATELQSREVGTSPFTAEAPVDVTKASSWTAYLKKANEEAKAKPGDVVAQDKAFRANQNFEAFLARERAKKKKGQLSELGPEELKKLSKAKIEGTLKPEDLNFTAPTKKDLAPRYISAVEKAPTIGDNLKVVDLLGEYDPQIVKEIADTPEYVPLLNIIQNQFNFVQESLSRFDKRYKNAEFGGLNIKDNLGSHLSIPGQKSKVFVNPWNLLSEVHRRIKEGVTKDNLDDIVDDLSGQYVSTLIHEISHEIADTEAKLAGVYTRNIGHLIDSMPQLKEQLATLLVTSAKLMKVMQRHRLELILDEMNKYKRKQP